MHGNGANLGQKKRDPVLPSQMTGDSCVVPLKNCSSGFVPRTKGDSCTILVGIRGSGFGLKKELQFRGQSCGDSLIREVEICILGFGSRVPGDSCTPLAEICGPGFGLKNGLQFQCQS